MHDMTATAEPEPDVLAEFLAEQEAKGFLRFLTCGSVDDGKSTLIGRLLYDTKLLFEDQLATLERDSKKYGTAGDDIDFALLVDGLEAEHQQGITIDVAYRFFSTPKRKFIVADTPGHEQYTRNMATGASTSDLAVILIDARKGVLTQTLRHSCIVSLLGIRHVVLAINKMDLVDFSKERFDEILADYQPFAERFQFESLLAIPLSARHGDNVTGKSARTPWYDGPSLIDYLDTIEVESARIHGPLRMPVQWVNRPHLDFRGFSGTIVSGRVKPGDRVVVARSGRTTTVKRIVTMSGDLDEAIAGDAVTLTLADEVDISRGDCIAAADHRPTVADQFAGHLLWMTDDELMPGRSYLLKCAGQTVNTTVSELKYRLDINNFDHIAAKTLELNEVGFANLSLAHPIAFDAYADIRDMGAFILVDRYTNQTVGAGMIDFALRRASNIHMQTLDVGKISRGHALRQRSAILWFTGLSGAGKSTIANIVEKKLHAMGHATYVLDGDNVRHGLNRDLGFTDADRVENIRRVAEVSKLMIDAGLITLVSFISPFRAERRMARELVDDGEFIEIYVSTPLKLAEERDPKGLYKKARAGEIKHFTGIDSPYEEPEIAEMVLDTSVQGANELADEVITWLRKRGYLH